MKNDWQHNDANFGNLSESDLVDNVSINIKEYKYYILKR